VIEHKYETVEVKFPTVKQALLFQEWLVNGGGQDFQCMCEVSNLPGVSFEYGVGNKITAEVDTAP